ncbi:MAG: LysR family transcriptional regulator, transcriptional activator of the cysJI operon [Clostridiales bacterium]|nr:LysR family transcriptional regulator, transcriptional activator of the cysJI operon [Clostridiales bacterium]
MLDFRIQTFLCVCKHMNYTKAAKELGITQPAVSQHIRYLEDYYEDILFLYTGKNLTLTAAGKLLLDAMISIHHDELHLKKSLIELKKTTTILRFGATLTIGDYWIPEKLLPYLKQNPSQITELTIANTKELLSLLDAGGLDFAVIEGYFNKQQYEFRTLSKEPYILVCAYDYPLTTIDCLTDLFSHPLLVREDGSGTKEILTRFLSEHGYNLSDFSNVSTINSIHVMKELTREGLGITFLYEAAVKKELQNKTLRKINLLEFHLEHEFNFIVRKNSIFLAFYLSLFEALFNPPAC